MLKEYQAGVPLLKSGRVDPASAPFTAGVSRAVRSPKPDGFGAAPKRRAIFQESAGQTGLNNRPLAVALRCNVNANCPSIDNRDIRRSNPTLKTKCTPPENFPVAAQFEELSVGGS